MVDKTGEMLSELVDCEGEAAALDLTVQRTLRDPELYDRWRRFHLIGAALNGHLPAAMDPGFAGRLHAAIGAEPRLAPQREAPRRAAGWRKPLAGFALAASVAALVTFNTGLLHGEGSRRAADATTHLVAAGPPDAGPRAAAASEERTRSRLASFLVNHSERASMSSVRGVVPYVQLVGHDPRR